MKTEETDGDKNRGVHLGGSATQHRAGEGGDGVADLVPFQHPEAVPEDGGPRGRRPLAAGGAGAAELEVRPEMGADPEGEAAGGGEEGDRGGGPVEERWVKHGRGEERAGRGGDVGSWNKEENITHRWASFEL